MRKIGHVPTSIIFIFVILILYEGGLAWDDTVTHKDLSEYAAESSILQKCIDQQDNNCDFLKILGLSKGLIEPLEWNGNSSIKKGFIREWLREGAMLEDAGTKLEAVTGKARFNNHFHNPLKPWIEAGLDDWIGPLHYTGKSSLVWAQDGGAQLSIVEGAWTWQMARFYYHLALTSASESSRQENFAKTFKGVGHQMHLLQDTAVPDHVRNDAHPEDALFGKDSSFGRYYFETWTKSKIRNIAEMRSFAPNPILPNVTFKVSYNSLAPVTQLFDAEMYNGLNASAGVNQGLSEYTNANFFSNDTIFAAERYSSDHRHYFPYPRRTSTDLQSYINQNKLPEIVIAEDGVPDTSFWIKKERDGEYIEHFLKPSYLSVPLLDSTGQSALYLRTFYRDDECHKDYVKALLPRVVGYSAGLLNYFFRGTLEISAPDTYVYSITDGSSVPQQFTKIKAKVKNITSNEAMINGFLHAVAKYKVIPNYDPSLASYPPDGAVMKNIPYSYSVSSPMALMSEQLASMNMYPTQLTFDFTNSPIPAGITDLSLQIIFKGTLGNETETAIAVGMKDLMEPTHHVFWNLTDMFALDGHLYTADQIRANPTLLQRAGDANIDPHAMSLSIGYMNSSPHALPVLPVATANDIPAGRFIRLLLLTDSSLTNNYGRLTYIDSIDAITSVSDFGFEGVLNSEVAGVWQPPTPIDTLRNVRQHFNVGILHCRPKSVDPVTGGEYCPYPQAEAIPANTIPYPPLILFQ